MVMLIRINQEQNFLLNCTNNMKGLIVLKNSQCCRK